MRTKRSLCVGLAIALTAFSCARLSAQQALDAGGGKIPLEAGRFIEFAIGEVATATIHTPGEGSYYTSGVIQPWYRIIVGVNDLFDAQYYLKAFPNPVGHYLAIETNYPDFQFFRFSNLLGQKMVAGAFDNSPIDLAWMAAGVYFLTLTSDDQRISKTIKIVKQ